MTGITRALTLQQFWWCADRRERSGSDAADTTGQDDGRAEESRDESRNCAEPI